MLYVLSWARTWRGIGYADLAIGRRAQVAVAKPRAPYFRRVAAEVALATS